MCILKVNDDRKRIDIVNLLQAGSQEQLEQIEKLYLQAFPSCERKPFSHIVEAGRRGQVDILYLERDGAYEGLAITMKDGDLVLLDYFAIDGSRRGQGCGSEALKALFDFYAGKRFFLEIECLDPEAENLEQRKRRKTFYLRNGMTELGIVAGVFGTEMELLGHQMELTFDAYQGVYRAVYGDEKAGHIKLVSQNA